MQAKEKKLTTVLLIEDDVCVGHTLVEALLPYGFLVRHVENAEECFSSIAQNEPDLILLDLELPGIMGPDICRSLRQMNYKHTPIVALSGCQDENQIVKMLEAGADDFVAKSQSLPVLVAHIRAVLQRGERLRESAASSDLAEWGPIRIDKTTRRVWVLNREADLTPTEFGLLETFVSFPGAVFTRNQLIDRLHGIGHVVTPRTIDVHINALRSQLGEYRTALQTVRGVGYRFAESLAR